MPSYATLDAIADTYTPLLALACLVLLLRPLRALQWRVLGIRAASLAAGAFVAYGLMFMDNRLEIWPIAQLDYSTHTAVALVLAIFLTRYWPASRLICWVSLGAYGLLMLYQRYHSLADILSTAAVVAVLYLRAELFIHRLARRAQG
ncbi:hypothetical protein [Noviherbaspirillum sp. ST9]|uniref:hypothetical protein n=1 Tax=Noviherbaspirillum sp. ST9 TaxID=3401606 RepID=UPI003B587EE7